MKRNIKIIVLIIIIIFLSVILIKIYDTDINPIIKNETIIKQNKMLTMMFESTTETGVYEADDEETSFDQSGYYFNPNLSGCEHGGTVSYKDNKVTMQSSYTDKCFVYFSTTDVTDDDAGAQTQNFANYIISLYNPSSEGTNGIYFHDGIGTYSTLEAEDYSYRYVGSNPNNYVCFGYQVGNKSVCKDTTNNKDYLYRIIGVFNKNFEDKTQPAEYQVKLIKYDFATTDMLGTNGESSGNTFAASDYANYQAKNLSSTVARYYWSRQSTTYSGSTYYNIWSISPLNTINLNTNYISYLNTNNSAWTSMIATTSWKVGGNTWANIAEKNAKTAYTNEITNAESGVQSAYPVTNKIGLMYVSDYMYAANPTYWSKYGSNSGATQDYRAAINDNWMYMGVYEWTVSRRTDRTNNAFRVYYAGSVGSDSVNFNYLGVRPSFYLESSVENVGIHSGTREDPYILNTGPIDIHFSGGNDN